MSYQSYAITRPIIITICVFPSFRINLTTKYHHVHVHTIRTGARCDGAMMGENWGELLHS
jgi:hypothetical protein